MWREFNKMVSQIVDYVTGIIMLKTRQYLAIEREFLEMLCHMVGILTMWRKFLKMVSQIDDYVTDIIKVKTRPYLASSSG
jgi:nicotinate-nucleotide pyrophosphorylase